MVFDLVYVRDDAASLDYSFQGQDEREHLALVLHHCILVCSAFAAVVTVFAALLAFNFLLKFLTACKGQLLSLMPYLLLVIAFSPAVLVPCLSFG